MNTLLIEVINPNAEGLLQELEDLQIIRVLEKENVVKRRRVKKFPLNIDAVRKSLSSIKGNLSDSVIEQREERI